MIWLYIKPCDLQCVFAVWPQSLSRPFPRAGPYKNGSPGLGWYSRCDPPPQRTWSEWVRSWSISCELALRWMLHDLTDDKSTLVQVMAWCHQATSHYLSQWWPRSMSPYGVTRPQRINGLSWTGRKKSDHLQGSTYPNFFTCPTSKIMHFSICSYGT